MKNRFFSKDLYVEGLSQLKTVGIVTACVFAVLSLIVPLLNTDGFVDDISIYLAAIFAFFVPYIVTPILMFKIFWFMFKRNKSDFYHSIPQKRSCIYCSFTLSALTYVIAQIFICFFIGISGVVVTGNYITNLSKIFTIIPNLISTSLLIASAILIAIGVTGRFFSALTVSCMILFYPRWFFVLFKGAMESGITLIDGTHFLPDELLNLNSFFSPKGSIYSIIYTLIISVVYFVFGMFLFKRKKSQTAEKPTSSKRAHSIIRICFSLLFCSVGVTMIYSNVFSEFYLLIDYIEDSEKVTSISVIIIMFLIALLSYFVYDIIANRSANGVSKAVKDLVFLASANVLMFAIITGSTLVFTCYTPKVENIESVEIISYSINDISNEDYYGVYSVSQFDYFMLGRIAYDNYEYSQENGEIDTEDYSYFADSKEVDDILSKYLFNPITDKNAIKIICDSYNKRCKTYKILKCKINEKGKTYYRDIVFDKKNLSKLINYFDFDKKAFTKDFENYVNKASNIYCWDNLSYEYALDKKAKKAVLKATAEDLKNISDKDFAKMLLAKMDYNDYISKTKNYESYNIVGFGVGFKTKDKKYYAYNVFPFMTKTIDTIVHYSNEYWKNKDEEKLLNKYFDDLKKKKISFLGDYDVEDESEYQSNCYFMALNAFAEENGSTVSKQNQKNFYNEIQKRKLDVTKRNSKDDLAVYIKYSPANSNKTLDKYIYIPKDLCKKYFRIIDSDEE